MLLVVSHFTLDESSWSGHDKRQEIHCGRSTAEVTKNPWRRSCGESFCCHDVNGGKRFYDMRARWLQPCKIVRVIHYSRSNAQSPRTNIGVQEQTLTFQSDSRNCTALLFTEWDRQILCKHAIRLVLAHNTEMRKMLKLMLCLSWAVRW